MNYISRLTNIYGYRSTQQQDRLFSYFDRGTNPLTRLESWRELLIIEGKKVIFLHGCRHP